MSHFQSYIDRMIKDIDCNDKMKKELSEELEIHLEMLLQEYLDQGYSLDEAMQCAFADFGNPKEIGKELKKTMVGGIIMKKVVLGLFGICILVLGVLCIFKIFDLLTTPHHVGIDIDFYGLEIKKGVPEGFILNYVIGFLGVGVISLIVGGVLLKSGFKKLINHHN
ncbi:permease prefix domain 1-containing protein [Paenactinomyces guangxiensis]|uniref:Uncharacterized protein n=1 Tax=Paenactinomyces guangxiensis TaxID=1490290 RepID=A0A7W2AAK9_9BACL|nr:permease prefix domain 1-containing protein [Paenactinomyces guangxiensis]MBA4496367.1 hypothetical protein [Paenactinomyces guangxiensis]MBH8593520.1 hypothetical protein [Paenactinomyces guangxiensis]